MTPRELEIEDARREWPLPMAYVGGKWDGLWVVLSPYEARQEEIRKAKESVDGE